MFPGKVTPLTWLTKSTYFSLQPNRPHRHLMPVTIISMNYERFRKESKGKTCGKHTDNKWQLFAQIMIGKPSILIHRSIIRQIVLSHTLKWNTGINSFKSVISPLLTEYKQVTTKNRYRYSSCAARDIPNSQSITVLPYGNQFNAGIHR